MRDLTRHTFRFSLLTTLVGMALASHPAKGGEEPSATSRPEKAPAGPPIFIFLKAPADLESFWKRWNNPDFVLQRGSEYEKLLELAKTAGRPADATRSGIDSLAARGKVVGELAHLAVDFGISIAGSQTVWIPIRLDGLTVTEASEKDRALPLREFDGGWQIELSGEGTHHVRVELLVPVKPTTEGRWLEMAIPEVASTQIQLDVDPRVVEAVAGAKDLVAIQPSEDGPRTRLTAHLSPRRQLELRWRYEAEPRLRLSPLLTARGEIAVDLDLGTLRTRSSWVIGATRGSVQTLVLRLDGDDELLELELDDEPIAVEPLREGATVRVMVPLAEPLRPGASRRLLLVTRRPLAPGTGASCLFRGFPLEGAVTQSGVVAVGQGADLWIEGDSRRGLRQIDLRELPSELRSRPSTVQAYQFLEQPFELGLNATPSPPHVRVDSQSTVTIGPGLARLETNLDYHVTRGRVYELKVGLPAGLDLESAGPEEVVASYQWTPETVGAAPPELSDVPRVLSLRLSAKAREAGTFRINLAGRQSIEPSRPFNLGLFQPRSAVSGGGRIAVSTARNVSVDLAPVETGRDGAEFTSAGHEPPANWAWPQGHSAADRPPVLWLQHGGAPSALPLRVVVQPRTVHHETTVSARLDRRRLDVVQDTVCHVHHGTLNRVDVSVPPSVEGLWNPDGDEVLTREPLKLDPDGQHRYRLTLRREMGETFRLRFRYRILLENALVPDHPTRILIPWLRVLEGTDAVPKIKVTADPGVGLRTEGTGWATSGSEELGGTPTDDKDLDTLTLIRSQPGSSTPAVIATARSIETLPSQVASRLLVRAVMGAEGMLRTSAWFRFELHDPVLSFGLPRDAELARVRVGGEAVTEVERLGSGGYRLRLPARSSNGPLIVSLEYSTPSAAGAGPAWSIPRLLDGGLVQETFLEVAVPWNHVVVGVPEGWTDENRWYWDTYLLKRRPGKEASTLTAWVAGSSARAPLADEPTDGGRRGYQAYLFRRQGDPTSLRLWMLPRAGIVALCSGTTLALGVLLLIWRPAGGLVLAAAIGLALVLAGTIQPSLTCLAIDSAIAGILLTLLAVVMQHRLDRRRRVSSPFLEPGGLLAGPTTGSSLGRISTVGSDDSTAIRFRPGSTREHITPSYPGTADNAASEGPGLGH